MLGLIKKDLLMIIGNLKTLIIICIVFAIMSINGEGNFSFIPAFLSVMLMMTTFSYDEYNNTNAYIIALPNGKRNAIKAKYLSTFLIVFISLLLTFIFQVGVGTINRNLNLEEILSITYGCGIGILLLQSILYPTIYKFGIEKSRIGIFVGVFGITTIASLLMKSNLSISIPQNLINIFTTYGEIIILILTIIFLFISYKISEKIYNKKEF